MDRYCCRIKVDVLGNRKEKINIINLQQVDNDYRINVQTANNAYYTALNKETWAYNQQKTQLNNEANGKPAVSNRNWRASR